MPKPTPSPIPSPSPSPSPPAKLGNVITELSDAAVVVIGDALTNPAATNDLRAAVNDRLSEISADDKRGVRVASPPENRAVKNAQNVYGLQ